MAQKMTNAIIETIRQVTKWADEAGIDEAHTCNFAVTDGKNIVVSRYVSVENKVPESLYYTQGERFICEQGIASVVEHGASNNCLLIASEPLTQVTDYWKPVPPNHCLAVSPNLEIKLTPIT